MKCDIKRNTALIFFHFYCITVSAFAWKICGFQSIGWTPPPKWVYENDRKGSVGANDRGTARIFSFEPIIWGALQRLWKFGSDGIIQ